MSCVHVFENAITAEAYIATMWRRSLFPSNVYNTFCQFNVYTQLAG